VSNRRFEEFEHRQVLARMRQGDSDRDIVRAGLMGRKKLASGLRQTDCILFSFARARVILKSLSSSDEWFRTTIASTDFCPRD
jgi:hypothetical protein